MAVKSHYDVLGVERTANAQQIKRAYFGLVRQYPPERFPEEFKVLRTAYDTLSNEEKRGAYDDEDALVGALSEGAKYLFDQAQKATRQGRHAQAADIYDLILKEHPTLTGIHARYAESLEWKGKPGKAMDVWKQLCEQEPDNVEYALELANSYASRGWRKKAVAEYERALKIDNSNAACWLGLVDCYGNADEFEDAQATCLMAIDVLKKAGTESVHFYILALMFHLRTDTTGDGDDMERYLQNIVRLMRANPVSISGRTKADLPLVIMGLTALRVARWIPYVQEIVGMLPYGNDGLSERLSEYLAKAVQSIELEGLIEGLEEKGFSEEFHDIFQHLHEGCECEECRLGLMLMECNILVDKETFAPQLRRLKQEYPQLYDLHAGFFNQVLRTRDPEPMIRQRVKAMNKHGFLSQFMEGEDDDEVPIQPVRRTEPKVGRNDPCPCGSGKKYKKCCGV